MKKIQAGIVQDMFEAQYLPNKEIPRAQLYSALTASELQTVTEAEEILRKLASRAGTAISCPADLFAFLEMRLGHLVHEEFHIVHLDNRHRVLGTEFLFRGTVDGASIHPREVIRAVLHHNTAAVVFAHCHPSGVSDPSAADRAITRELKEALSYVGVRVLDHIVVGSAGSTSMKAKGLV